MEREKLIHFLEWVVAFSLEEEIDIEAIVSEYINEFPKCNMSENDIYKMADYYAITMVSGDYQDAPYTTNGDIYEYYKLGFLAGFKHKNN